MSLGLYLKMLRLKAGFTQKQLAMCLGTVRQLISKYERNKVKPSPNRLYSIIEICQDNEIDTAVSECISLFYV